ncbi:hypothetical protein [Pseudorhodoplanes sp.]|uniref:hypothetical protein n=1 Tax=Pseudorhodoplanes sp. TaxID=1934341 RepID=UPI002CD1A587|nr:hypothetical protein [Pseudorhodoplanes sp.]HWV55039.1 hypothetical protein [Pseudorhodoplanes sp.]
MQYEIVKQEDCYVIIVDGQSVMKLKSRRQAVKLLTAVLESQDPAERPASRAAAAGGGR